MPSIPARFRFLLFDSDPLVTDSTLPWSLPQFRAFLSGVPDEKYPHDGLLNPASIPPGFTVEEHTSLLALNLAIRAKGSVVEQLALMRGGGKKAGADSASIRHLSA